MPVAIGPDQLPSYGIVTRHEQMDNGELRFRLAGADGSGYIRNENRGGPVWENSHSHAHLQEMVLVQSGCVVYVELVRGAARFRLLRAGEFTVTIPGVAHNEFVDGGAVVHTVKFGDCADADWVPSPALDELTKPLTWEQALRRCTVDAEGC